MHRSIVTLLVILGMSLAAPTALAKDQERSDDRFEVTFVGAFNALTGDTGDFFDSGPFGGVAFEFALNKPYAKREFRSMGVRLTAGYARYESSLYDSPLEGPVFGIDFMVTGNLTPIFKPFGFLGITVANTTDDNEFVTGSEGGGFAFGAGTKLFFGEWFMGSVEVSHQSYQVEGSYSSSPSTMSYVQVRFGVGARF